MRSRSLATNTDEWSGHDDLHCKSAEEATLRSELMASFLSIIEIVSVGRFDCELELHHFTSLPHIAFLYLPSLVSKNSRDYNKSFGVDNLI